MIHEQDLRGALGVPGAALNAGLRSVRDRFLGRFRAGVGELPPILLSGGDWRFGTAEQQGTESVVVQACEFDLLRALLSRRSAAQLRSWTTAADIDPYLPACATLGPLPDRDLQESAGR